MDGLLTHHLKRHVHHHLGDLFAILDLATVRGFVRITIKGNRELASDHIADRLALVLADRFEHLGDDCRQYILRGCLISVSVRACATVSVSSVSASSVSSVSATASSVSERSKRTEVRVHSSRRQLSSGCELSRFDLASGLRDLSAGLQVEHRAEDLLDRLLGNLGVARRERIGRLVVGQLVLLQRIAQALGPSLIFGLGTCDRLAAVLDPDRERISRNEFSARFARTIGLDRPGVVELGRHSAAATAATATAATTAAATARLRRARLAAIGQEVRHEAGRTIEPVVRCEVANLDVRERQIWRMVGHERRRDRVRLRVAVLGLAREVQRQVRQERGLDLRNRIAVLGSSLD